jgi:hypothetical protein
MFTWVPALWEELPTASSDTGPARQETEEGGWGGWALAASSGCRQEERAPKRLLSAEMPGLQGPEGSGRCHRRCCVWVTLKRRKGPKRGGSCSSVSLPSLLPFPLGEFNPAAPSWGVILETLPSAFPRCEPHHSPQCPHRAVTSTAPLRLPLFSVLQCHQHWTGQQGSSVKSVLSKCDGGSE